MGQRGIVSDEATVRRKNGLWFDPMCRLHVDSAAEGSAGDSAAAVLQTSRCSGGRGVKRRRCEGEDQEERQVVLTLCLAKLQSVHQQAEPSLHRSVLLSNTLRQLQLQHDTNQREDQLPPEVPPAPSLGTLASDLQSPDRDGWCCDSLRTAPDFLFGTFEMANSTSYLTDLQLDDIFEDIDTSMYDPTDFPVLRGHTSRGGGALMWSPASQRQPCSADLAELDHIMELLVHS